MFSPLGPSPTCRHGLDLRCQSWRTILFSTLGRPFHAYRHIALDGFMGQNTAEIERFEDKTTLKLLLAWMDSWDRRFEVRNTLGQG
ncbi:hypothetical protein H0E87_025973 [Populus deltoides]|uniref:Uncharacterized protein n=1 Tax=Populus deltoides TaxID=3696 RepID=A0A8T2X495_POPDE|nr:hypothetical protein H0E87_025973 [Populus deltoides]